MTKHSDGKYNKILHAAIEVISKKGLEKTAISDIVKRAGVAQGTFYLYFQSKSALIPAMANNLLTTTLEAIKEKVNDGQSFWGILEICINETFRITNEYKDVIVLCYSGLAIDHSLEKWETIYQPYYDWFEKVLLDGIANKDIDQTIHVKWTARMVINLMENAAERFYIGQEQNESLEMYKQEVTTFLRRSLGGT